MSPIWYLGSGWSVHCCTLNFCTRLHTSSTLCTQCFVQKYSIWNTPDKSDQTEPLGANQRPRLFSPLELVKSPNISVSVTPRLVTEILQVTLSALFDEHLCCRHRSKSECDLHYLALFAYVGSYSHSRPKPQLRLGVLCVIIHQCNSVLRRPALKRLIQMPFS